MKKLTPLNVPWMVAPSTPKLTLTSTEDGESILKFVGLFDFENPSVSLSSETVMIESGASLVVNQNEPSARYQLIGMYFDLVGWIRRSPQFSDREVICESDYDWSKVRGVLQNRETIPDWRHRVSQEWAETRICPNPCAYIVDNSDWISDSDRNKYDLKHFLILGESSYIEIMARDFYWRSHGNVTR